MTNWTEMSEFDGIDLTESYVLGWCMADDELHFDLDVALAPGHPAYHPPRPGERTYWHRGALTFPHTRDVIGLEQQHAVRGGTDASGERDYGNIDTFVETDGEFRLCGEFGDVRFRSARPVLELRPSPS